MAEPAPGADWTVNNIIDKVPGGREQGVLQTGMEWRRGLHGKEGEQGSLLL